MCSVSAASRSATQPAAPAKLSVCVSTYCTYTSIPTVLACSIGRHFSQFVRSCSKCLLPSILQLMARWISSEIEEKDDSYREEKSYFVYMYINYPSSPTITTRYNCSSPYQGTQWNGNTMLSFEASHLISVSSSLLRQITGQLMLKHPTLTDIISTLYFLLPLLCGNDFIRMCLEKES